MVPAPRFIASDIDGTFIDPAHRVTARTRDVVVRAIESGAHFALATGRPYRWIAPVLEQLPVRPLCVTSNGAVVYDSLDDRVVRAEELSPAVMAGIVERAEEVLGSIAVAAERAGTSAADPTEDMYVVDAPFAARTDYPGYGVADRADVVAEPAVKLIVRNLDMTSAQMYARLAPLVDATDAHVTYSMPDGLLEIAAPGVTKEHGVSYLAEHYGVAASEVIAFGDMPNDIEMLRWAGCGVAMGNAHDDVKEAADIITETNGQAGVARVLERWF
ncbi:HAD family hydrolase [Corynebacterium sp. 32222D000AT]|uniref:HAD family hydrolase n=1 Tax=unclassified Corynebacterium TaxID=2624378 RepID=UPI002A9D28CE|nr:HAD family hydrolase [Mycobacteriaceae bacterium]MDY5829963.1 HAD family hydrolase [Corynebacterium sp.]